MNIQQENTNIEAPQTKWELINKVTQELKEASGKVAYTADKIKTGRPYMGDPTAENASNKAKVKALQKVLEKLLK